MPVPRDSFRDLYNAVMTFQTKKRKRAKRERMEHRSIETQSKENRFIDPRLTERRNPDSANIDLASAAEIVDVIAAEDRSVPAAVYSQRAAIARAIEHAEATGLPDPGLTGVPDLDVFLPFNAD